MPVCHPVDAPLDLCGEAGSTRFSFHAASRQSRARQNGDTDKLAKLLTRSFGQNLTLPFFALIRSSEFRGRRAGCGEQVPVKRKGPGAGSSDHA